jgi:predicted RND superfamily exporter protein
MQRLVHGLGSLIVRHRVALLVGFGLLAALALSQLPKLETDASPERLVQSHDEEAVLSEELRAQLAGSDRVLVLLVQADDVLEPAPLGYVHRLSRELGSEPYVERVESVTVTPVLRPALGPAAVPIEAPPPEVQQAIAALAAAAPERFPYGAYSVAGRLQQLRSGPLIEGEVVTREDARRVRAALVDAPLIEGRLVSEDRRVAAVALTLAGDDHDARARAVDRVERWIAEHPPPTGVTVDEGGLPVIRRALARGIEADQTMLLPITALVCAVLMYLAFRWLVGVLASLVTVGVAALLVVGGMAGIGLPMNVLTNVVPMLLVVIGVTDAIHLVSRYREDLARTPDRVTAATHTVRTMAAACFFTSVTTAIGLGSLVVSRTSMLREFGLVTAVGVMITYLVTIGLLPAMLPLLRAPRPAPPGGDRLSRGVATLTRGVLAHRGIVLVATAGVLVVAAWSALGVEVDTRLLDPFDRDDPAARAVRLMEAELEGVRPLEVLVTSEDASTWRDPAVLQTLDETAVWLERQPAALGTATPSEPLHALWAALLNDPAAREEPFRSSEQVAALATLAGERALERHVLEGGRTLRRVGNTKRGAGSRGGRRGVSRRP